jgi:hypothetical protein
LGEQIEKNEVGRAGSTQGGEKRCIQGFGGETLVEREYLEVLGVDGKKILS